MTYVVTVTMAPPEGTPDLDALQREGVLFLLRKGFDSLEAIEGPDGTEVDLMDDLVAVHPGGALLKLFVDAPALEFAEEAAREVVTELLDTSEPLADWQITRCAVELNSELLQESLDAADGPDAPPADPAERARRHAAGDHPPSSPGDTPAPTEAEAMRTRLRELAPLLTSFPLTAFGYAGEEPGRAGSGETAGAASGEVTGGSAGVAGTVAGDPVSSAGPANGEVTGAATGEPTGAAGTVAGDPVSSPGPTSGEAPRPIGKEAAEIAAGALIYAIDLLVDELFTDLAALEEDGPTVARSNATFMILDDLPPHLADEYTVLFTRRLTVTAITLTSRLTRPPFGPPTCVAERLLLGSLLTQAEVTADLYGLLTDEVAKALENFATSLNTAASHPTHEAPESWFTPFTDECRVHPYAANEEPEETLHELPD
ncbi:hypothetical protein [Streptomyces sp. NPDC059575]|uniref:hypothetical protein n=1 Tax=Streptomyces sp. NPDC059575 TaxID=3346872 RepID=UPI00369F2C7C